MNYTLVKPDGTVGDTRDFTTAPPTLAPNKGKWLPDNPPAYNPATHTRTRGPQSVNAAEIAYIVTARPLATVRAEKIASLEQARQQAIATLPPVTVAGKQYPATPEYREIVTGVARRQAAGRPIPATLRGVDGTSVSLNAALIAQIDDTITAAVQEAWDRYWQRFDAVQAATTVEQVDGVAW